MTKTKLTKKLVIVLAIATSSFLLTAVFATPSLFVNAVMQQNMMQGKSMMNNGHQLNGVYANNIPQINGTLNLKNNTNGISIKNMSVPFLTAAQNAQNAIVNGTIINGHIGVTQGYLTYNFAVTNPTNNTLSNVIVDAGNGKVLYTSPGISINSTQFAMNGMKGTNGMNGMAGGFGHGMNGMAGGFGHGGFGHGGFGHGGLGHCV
jgi:uncharacterized membrane protein YkoI